MSGRGSSRTTQGRQLGQGIVSALVAVITFGLVVSTFRTHGATFTNAHLITLFTFHPPIPCSTRNIRFIIFIFEIERDIF